MEAQLKGAVLIALVVVPQWRCPILKPLSAKLPPKLETAPHSLWQNGKILGPGRQPQQSFLNTYCNSISGHKISQYFRLFQYLVVHVKAAPQVVRSPAS